MAEIAGGRSPGHKSQLVQFYMAPKKDDEASAREGRPIYKDVPWVKIFIPGDKDSVYDNPAWLDESHPNSHVNRYPDAWAAFKRGDGEAVIGTPLELMPGISKAQVEELKHFHCRTVEALAAMSDGNAQKFAGLQKMKAEAQAYLDRAAGAAPEKRMREELEKRDAELAALKAQMAQVLATVGKSGAVEAAMDAVGEGVEDVPAPAPKRRGRPPKAPPVAEG